MPAPVPLPVAVLPVPPAPCVPMPVPDIEPLIDPSLPVEPEPDIVPDPDDMPPEPDDIEPPRERERDREPRRVLPRVDEPVLDEPMLDWLPEPIVESLPAELLVPPIDWPLLVPIEPLVLPMDPVEPVCAMARAGTANAPSAKVVRIRIIDLLLKSGLNGRCRVNVPARQPVWAR